MGNFRIRVRTTDGKTAQYLASDGTLYYETREKAQEQVDFLTRGGQPEWFVSADVVSA